MAVRFDQHIDIDAPPDRVWSVLTNPGTWPMWFPDVEGLSNLTAVSQGATFSYGSGGHGSVVAVEESTMRLKVVTQDGPVPVSHTFDIDRAGGFLGVGANDSRLRYTLEYDPPGGFLSDFVAGGNPKDMLKVKHTLEKIKNLSEGK